jgi:hypothetical protein
MRNETRISVGDTRTEQALDVSASAAYDCVLDILKAYKLTGNLHINLEIILNDMGAAKELTFDIAPKRKLGFHRDCRRVVFRRKETVSADRFSRIMRSLSDRIGLDAKRSSWRGFLSIAKARRSHVSPMPDVSFARLP